MTNVTVLAIAKIGGLQWQHANSLKIMLIRVKLFQIALPGISLLESQFVVLGYRNNIAHWLSWRVGLLQVPASRTFFRPIQSPILR
jgi:hypothetical protein